MLGVYEMDDLLEKTLNVLLIEDNPGDARLLQEALNDRSGASAFEIQWVQTLAEGLDRISANHVEAVLLHLSLPDSHDLPPMWPTTCFMTLLQDAWNQNRVFLGTSVPLGQTLGGEVSLDVYYMLQSNRNTEDDRSSNHILGTKLEPVPLPRVFGIRDFFAAIFARLFGESTAF